MNDVPLFHEPDRAPPPTLYPNLPQAVGILLLAIVLQTVIGTGFTLVFGGEENFMRIPSLWGLANLLSLSPVIVYAWRRAGGTLDIFRLRAIHQGLVVPLVFCVIGTGILVSELDNVVHTIIGPPPEALNFSWMFTGEWRQIPGLVFLLLVVAPITEELLFRGLILRGLLSRFGAGPAVALTALLFAAFHVNPWQFLGAFVLGLLFGWFYLVFRSLVPCLIGHAAANGFPLVVSFAFPSIPGFSLITDQVQFQPLWLDAAGLSLAACGSWWLRRALITSGQVPAR